MSTLGELVAFRALVNLLGPDAEKELREALEERASCPFKLGQRASCPLNPLTPLYSRFTEEQHAAEIARLLTPPGTKAEVKVVYQTVENLRRCLQQSNRQTTEPPNHPIGDWYFTGDYPTPGGYKVLRKALLNYLEKNSERSY
jgi:amidophosphoribosyltransferase